MPQNMIGQRSDNQDGPTYGIITAKTEEWVAVEILLDNPQPISDHLYTIGDIPDLNGGTHRLVLARSLTQGTNSATSEATSLLHRFPTIQTLIMVGIAGGIPNPDKPSDHVRLGDVVVSSEYGVAHYGMVREEPTGITSMAFPRPPDPRLLRAAQNLEAAQKRSAERPWLEHMERAKQRRKISRPDDDKDVLWSSTELPRLVPHPDDGERRKGEPRVFIGRIASANILLKHPARRDELRKQDFKAVEMEGAGVADAAWQHSKSFFVIRGISDYCDSNKDDTWQPYAAIAAAAYARALIETIPGQMSDELRSALNELSSPDTSKRVYAARWLGSVRQSSAVRLLAEQLWREPDPEVKLWIITAVGQIGGEDAKKALLAFIQQFGNNMDSLTRLAVDDALALTDQHKDPQ